MHTYHISKEQEAETNDAAEIVKIHRALDDIDKFTSPRKFCL